jgi:GGDEF domain-containing protein
MPSIVRNNQKEFQSFNLINLPILLFSVNEKFEDFYNISVNVAEAETYQTLEKKLLNELDCLYQDNAETLLFNMEVTRGRKKYIYEYNAYKNNDVIVVHVVDIAKLKKAQYLLNSSNYMLEKYSAEMFTLAHTEQLKKTANRRALFAKFDALKNANVDLKCSISVLDIDHFKKFNDTYGHEFGDYVLESFVNISIN